MKKNISKVVTTVYIFLFSLSTTSLYADDFGPGLPIGGDAGEEPPPTPIDGWVPFMLVVAVGLIFYVTYKKQRTKKSLN